MEEKHRVQINFCGKNYAFQMISPEEESDMRSAVKMITQKIEGYKSKYANLLDFDALAISSLRFVSLMIKEKRNNTSNAFSDEIRVLNDRLQEYIDNNIND